MAEPNLTRPDRLIGWFPQPAGGRWGQRWQLDYPAAHARGFEGTEADWIAALAASAWTSDAQPMRMMGIAGEQADDHIWFTGSESVWILVPVTDPDRVEPPVGEANDLAAFSGLIAGQDIHIAGHVSADSLPLAAMSFWISEDHEDHWQTIVQEITGSHFEATVTVPESVEELGRIPYYWGLGLWVTPLEAHRNVTIHRLTISDGTTTYAWPTP